MTLLELSGKDLERELDRIIKTAPKRDRHWTPKEDSVLLRLYEAGVNYESMAKALGRTKMAVSLRLNALSVTNQPSA